jgi:hypothetical protein
MGYNKRIRLLLHFWWVCRLYVNESVSNKIIDEFTDEKKC